MSVDPVFVVLDRLSGVKQNREQWIARCPAHEDRTPSLSVRRGDDGRCLVNCFAGCYAEDVVAAVGLELKDLFIPSAPEQRKTFAKIRSRKSLLEVLDHELLVMNQILWTAKRIDLPVEDLERARVAAARINQVVDKIGV